MRILWNDTTKHYEVDGKETRGVGRIITAAGMQTDYSTVPEHILERAKQRGKHVDLACDYLDAGDLDWDSVHEPWKGYVKAWEHARAYYKLHVTRTQAVVYHPLLDYCGVIDVISEAPWHSNGTPLVDVDRKTSKGVHMNPYGLQTAAYSMPGIMIADPCTGELTMRELPQERWIMHLKATGRAKQYRCDDLNDWDDFRACVIVATPDFYTGQVTAQAQARLDARKARYNGA